jgi:ElaA protein
MEFHVSQWEDLTRDQLHSIVRLRVDVFVVEQNCPYPDLDGKDLSSLHVFSMREGEEPESGVSAASYIRICAPGVSYKEPSIGRVATALDRRGVGLGREIMLRAIEVCDQQWPSEGIRISAQYYLVQFYSDLGFVSTGEQYLEDNLPHIQMIRA